MSNESEIRLNLKRLIVDNLHLEGLSPDEIADDAPLFGAGLGLDSVDALELIVAIEKEYRITIKSHQVDNAIFASVSSLANFVVQSVGAGNGELSLDAG